MNALMGQSNTGISVNVGQSKPIFPNQFMTNSAGFSSPPISPLARPNPPVTNPNPNFSGLSKQDSFNFK